MPNIDLQPFFRSTVGYDQIAEILENLNNQKMVFNNYPPYDIEKITDEEYRIQIAVSGFDENDLEVVKQNNFLNIDGKIIKSENEDKKTYLYKGMAKRSFKLQFRLADHMEINTVFLKDGILNIHMIKNVPDEMKPQKIKINR